MSKYVQFGDQKLRGFGSKMGFWKCCRGVDRNVSKILFLVHFSLIFEVSAAAFLEIPEICINMVKSESLKIAKICLK